MKPMPDGSRDDSMTKEAEKKADQVNEAIKSLMTEMTNTGEEVSKIGDGPSVQPPETLAQLARKSPAFREKVCTRVALTLMKTPAVDACIRSRGSLNPTAFVQLIARYLAPLFNVDASVIAAEILKNAQPQPGD